jgi:hypothetical protein
MNASFLRTRSRSTTVFVRDSPILIKVRFQIEILVAGLHLEPDSLQRQCVEYQDAVAKHAVDQIDGSQVKQHQVHGFPQFRLQRALQLCARVGKRVASLAADCRNSGRPRG